jgi:hypothetical protein
MVRVSEAAAVAAPVDAVAVLERVHDCDRDSSHRVGVGFQFALELGAIAELALELGCDLLVRHCTLLGQEPRA